MKSLSLISAAIVAALGCGQAMALAPTATFDVVLVVSGSSAIKSGLENELSRVGSTICQTGNGTTTSTYGKYSAAVTSGPTPDINGYTCTTNAAIFGSAKNILIYYRAEGGSVFGLTPLIRNPANKVLR